MWRAASQAAKTLIGGGSSAPAAALERVGGHRPYLRRDSELCRWTRDGSFLMPKQNPGIRLEPDFVPDEALGEVVHATYAAYEAAQRDGADASPWGHGEALRMEALPPPVAQLARRIAGCGAFDVGPLRDLTIEGRDRSLFHHEPRVLPAEDGANVFVVSLLSSVVTTFTPAAAELEVRGLARRTSLLEVGERSWSDGDIDVLLQPRTLMHLTADARHTWMHGIRPGVGVDETVCDRWGAADYLLLRGERRFAVWFSFGAGLAAAT